MIKCWIYIISPWIKRAVLFRDKGCCVFYKKDLTGLYPGVWDERPFLMPDMVIGNRKNSAKEEGLYYKGQWQEIVLKENKDAMNWATQILV